MASIKYSPCVTFDPALAAVELWTTATLRRSKIALFSSEMPVAAVPWLIFQIAGELS